MFPVKHLLEGLDKPIEKVKKRKNLKSIEDLQNLESLILKIMKSEKTSKVLIERTEFDKFTLIPYFVPKHKYEYLLKTKRR